MGNKQVLAQIGVFALLGLNVGAYYVFWPHKDTSAQTDSKDQRQESGQTQLFPQKKDPPISAAAAPPKETPAGLTREAVPLHIPNPPAKPSEKKEDDDALGKLLEHIKNETGSTPIVSQTSESQPFIEQKKPSQLPPLQAIPLERDLRRPSDSIVAVTPAITPKLAPSPWLLNIETVGKQTQITAKLKQSNVEFRILCNHVDSKDPSAVHGLGNITFIGGGLKGTCQRLTLKTQEVQVVFEDQARIDQDGNPASTLRGDRILWELSPSTLQIQPLVAPAEFRPDDSVAPFRPGLDRPK